MIRLTCLFLVTMLVSDDTFGDESFLIFAPDRANQQLLSMTVSESGESVSITQNKPLSLPFSPAGTTVHPNGNQLIVTAGGNGPSHAASIEVLKEGELRLIASSKLNHPTGYTSIDRSGRYFMAAHYSTGAISVYGIDNNGTVGDEAYSFQTPNPEAHCILTTPDNRFVYIPCVKNNNALFQYAFDEATGQLSPLEPFNAMPPAMFGPRHVAYHPTLPIAYFSNEQQLGVSVYHIGTDGQLTDKQHATTFPRRSPFEQGKRDLQASDLVLTPDGKLLFVALRDFGGNEDSVFAFRVETGGKLSHIGRTAVGDIPWKLDISPSGNYLIVRESGTNCFSVFKVQSDGSLNKAASIALATGANDMSIMSLN